MLCVIYSMDFDKTHNDKYPSLQYQQRMKFVSKTFLACVCMHAKSLQLCRTLATLWTVACALVLMDRGEYQRIQAGILECVAMPYFRGSFWPSNQTHFSCNSGTCGMFFYLAINRSFPKLALRPTVDHPSPPPWGPWHLSSQILLLQISYTCNQTVGHLQILFLLKYS